MITPLFNSADHVLIVHSPPDLWRYRGREAIVANVYETQPGRNLPLALLLLLEGEEQDISEEVVMSTAFLHLVKSVDRQRTEVALQNGTARPERASQASSGKGWTPERRDRFEARMRAKKSILVSALPQAVVAPSASVVAPTPLPPAPPASQSPHRALVTSGRLSHVPQVRLSRPQGRGHQSLRAVCRRSALRWSDDTVKALLLPTSRRPALKRAPLCAVLTEVQDELHLHEGDLVIATRNEHGQYIVAAMMIRWGEFDFYPLAWRSKWWQALVLRQQLRAAIFAR